MKRRTRGDDSSPSKRDKRTGKKGLTAANKLLTGEPTAGCRYTANQAGSQVMQMH